MKDYSKRDAGNRVLVRLSFSVILFLQTRHICMTAFPLLMKLNLKNSKLSNEYSVCETFLKYIGICFTYLGKTISGFNFERISHGVIRAATAYLRPIFAGYDFTVKIGKGPVVVQMQCINKGHRESITFQAKAQYGSISNPIQTKKIRSTAFISFRYTPPNSFLKKGKTGRVTVIATRTSTGEIFTQQISILLLI